MRADEIWKLYEEKYANEPLVKIQKSVPDVTEAEGKHGWRVGGVQVHSSGNRVVVVVSNGVPASPYPLSVTSLLGRVRWTTC